MRWVFPGIILLLAASGLFLGQFVVNLIFVYIIVSIGLNILMGYTGQISVGHAGFLAIGAYLTAILSTHFQINPYILVMLSGLLTALVGFLIGLPALRLEGFYIAMETLAFGVVVSEVALHLDGLTGGADGMSIMRPEIFHISTDSDITIFLLLILPFTLFTLITAYGLLKSRFGRAFLAIKDGEIAASCLGIDTSKYKLISFTVSAFYTGLAGGLFAYAVTYISPDAFNLFLSIDFMAMVIIGGMGSMVGSVIGATLLTFLNQLLAGFQDLRSLIFGLAISYFMIFMPQGLSGLFKKKLGGAP